MRWESSDRYYVVRVTTDLLGDRVLQKYWGGLGNRLGGMATVAVGDAAIAASLGQIVRERAAHGYRLVAAGDSSHFQQPIKEVAMNTSCMDKSPISSRSSANAIQQKFDTRNSAQPHPEMRKLRARSSAPEMPSRLPAHSRNDSNIRIPQLFFPFTA